jgi:hypothetical protein
MKNKIYFTVLATMLIIGIAVLILYYSQDFTEKLTFSESVNFEDISFSTEENKESTYLDSASAKIGTLKLENNGYFSQLYTFPEIIGCVIFKDKTRPLQFIVTPDPDYYPNSRNNQASVKVGVSRKYELIGNYNGRNLLASAFTKEDIKEIQVYKLPKNERNPIDDFSSYDGYDEENNCDYLTDNEISLATISVN